MVRFAQRPSPIATVGIGLSIAAAFALDLATPLGVAVWAIYVAPVAACFFLAAPRAPLIVGLIASALMAVGYLLPGPGPYPSWIPVVNRSIGLLLVWSLAVMVRQAILWKLAIRKREWLQSGQTRLGELMRGDHEVSVLGGRILRFLAEYLDAQVGVMYAGEQGGLRRIAGWALQSDGEPGAPMVKRGEGLAGQVAADGRALLVTEVPDDHVKVTSGLGASRPRALLVAPTLADGQANGVVELGFHHPVYESDRELLEAVAEPIGMALRSAVYRTRLEELLDETQRQAEELQTQQEELRVSNEELEQQGQILREAHARLEEQQTDVEQTNARLEEQANELRRQKDELADAHRTLTSTAAALARANQYKSEFLANMSHELRTPLNSALILAKLLADNKQGNLTLDQVRYAETIYGAGNDLLTLINDILDLSRLEAGRVELTPESVELASVLAELRARFEPVANERHLTLELAAEQGAPASLVTDRKRLSQILNNLLSNALKFTEAGSVSLRIQAAPGDRLVFMVRDTGIGIAPEQQQVIFEAFRQADGTTNRRYGGTGLGLSIARELARRLGGDISVESAIGQGSTFRLTVPATPDTAAPRPPRPVARPEATRPIGAPVPSRPASRAAPAPAPAAGPNGGTAARSFDDDRQHRTRPGRLILVIEDDPAFGRILYDLAHELDFDCVVASTAREGMEMARTLAPSAILLDVGLPDGSGLEVLDRLKQAPETRPIPVHVISVADQMQAALELGAAGYAIKPVKRDELIAAIRNLEQRVSDTRRVLLVEDNDELRDSTRTLLSSERVDVVAVATAAEALEQLASSTFDCVVIDLGLQDGSGYDILEKMAAGQQYAFPPVIIYTGRELDRDEEQRLRRYSRSIVIKGARSPERLLDEVSLFLHQVETKLPPDQQRMLREVRHRDGVFEGRRILVVEDDVRSIFALSGVLEPRGAHLEVARNGREALARLERAADIDLVLMDIMMPEMDGLEAMREIRKRPDLARLPIIALTAKAMRDDREQCLAAGANDYIAKPIDVEKLVSLCRVWMPK